MSAAQRDAVTTLHRPRRRSHAKKSGRRLASNAVSARHRSRRRCRARNPGWKLARLRRFSEVLGSFLARNDDQPEAKRRRVVATGAAPVATDAGLATPVPVAPDVEKSLPKQIEKPSDKPPEKAPEKTAEKLDKPAEKAPEKTAEKPQEKPKLHYEASREEQPLKLVGEMAPLGNAWTYPLKSEEWRCFAGYLPGAIPKSETQRFFELVKKGTKWLQPTGRWGPLPLKTAWMCQAPCSCKYRYGGAEVKPEPYPSWMLEILEFCMPLCGLSDKASWPNSCNLNLYVDGTHSVGWHADNEALFQGKASDCRILSLSLGQARKFELRCKGDFHRMELSDGDLCTMEGLCQKHYLHRVPKDNAKSVGSRINLTWRWVVEHGKECELASTNPSAKKLPAAAPVSDPRGRKRRA